MFLTVLLIVVFLLTTGAAGLCLALNVKDCAVRLEARQLSNAALRMQARGDLGMPDRVATATGFRVAGGVVALCGWGLLLAALIAGLSA